MKAAIERLGIQFEVFSRDNHDLHQRLAELSEAMNERFDQIDARFEQVDARFDKLEATMNKRFGLLEKLITESHATLLALLKATPH